MYNKELLVTFGLLWLTYIYSPIISEKIKIKYPFFYEKVSMYINLLTCFMKFLNENNPTIIDYNDIIMDISEEQGDEKEKEKEKENTDINIVPYVEQRYEDKYLSKFKAFPNEFTFTEEEINLENDKFDDLKIAYETNRFEEIKNMQESLQQIESIIQSGGTNTDEGITKLLQFFNLEEEYQDDPDDIDLFEYMKSLLTKREMCEKNLKKITETTLTDEDFKKSARDYIINLKLSKYINNYISEHTPLGEVWMRYNNEKGSFEYFSNNTIPYRYLEPIGRKYVMTYWCKPLFVDLEEELKRAEKKFDEEKRKNEEDMKKNEHDKNNQKNVIAKLKSYNNKNTIKETTIKGLGKNRNQTNFVLPPQIKANLPNVNQTSEKQLLKERSNRYTWEGRLTNFCPLKKIDRKKMDKKLCMSFADFKRMQLEQQNKK